MLVVDRSIATRAVETSFEIPLGSNRMRNIRTHIQSAEMSLENESTYGSLLSRMVFTKRSSPSNVTFWGMFAVTFGTSKLLQNSKGLMLMMTSPLVSSPAPVSLIKISWAGTLLKLNCSGSKGQTTFWRSWGSLLCVALLEFNYWKNREKQQVH